MLLLLAMLEDDCQRELFSQLYQRYSAPMLRVALRYFPDDLPAAEDVVQSAWMRAIQYFSRIQQVPCNKQGAYLVMIVKNESLTQLKKRQEHLPLEESLAGEWPQPDRSGDICRLIDTLPESCRRVLEMRLVLGFSGQETADALGISRAVVNTRLHRGRQLLIEKLRQEGIVE